MPADDPANHRQPEPGAVLVFRGKERLQAVHPHVVRHSRARVADLQITA